MGSGCSRSKIDERAFEVGALNEILIVRTDKTYSFARETCMSDSRTRHLKRVTRAAKSDGSGCAFVLELHSVQN